MKLKYDRRSEKDRRVNKQDVPFPLKDCDGNVVNNNRRLKGDRRTEGLELSVSDMPDDEFNKFFKQFEKDESSSKNESVAKPAKMLEMSHYQVLYRKDAEYAYLTILYKDQEGATSPTIYATHDESNGANTKKENSPTLVENIHGTDAYQSYLERGWDDITESEDVYPLAIKSLLAQHMRPDTI